MSTTNPKRRPRLSGLEMFGFAETLGSVTSPGHVAVVMPETVAEEPPPAAPPVPADPFADWTPSEVGRGLTKGRVRWGLLTSMLLLFSGVAVLALWVYRLPQQEIERNIATFEAAATAISEDLDTFKLVNSSLDVDPLDTTVTNQTLLALEDHTRQAFAAAGALPATHDTARSRAIQASGTVSEAQRAFTEAYTYRLAIAPVLEPVSFETDPAALTLEAAAAAFADWETRFQEVRNALPEGVFANTTMRLHSLSAALPELQRSYLDGLRTETPNAAAGAVERLNRGLADVESSLYDGLSETKLRVDTLINEALEDWNQVLLLVR